MKEELIKKLAEVKIMREQCLKNREIIQKTKDEWHDILQRKIDLLSLNTEHCHENEAAYLELLRQKRMLS